MWTWGPMRFEKCQNIYPQMSENFEIKLNAKLVNTKSNLERPSTAFIQQNELAGIVLTSTFPKSPEGTSRGFPV